MEKKKHSNSDFKRSLHERGKLISGAEKVPYSKREVAKTTSFAAGNKRVIKKGDKL